ncbi:hypothetical protein ARMGADRAFT_392520 [Armillaria gallica]|uniref:SGTA homodimerisation domain-containing protein n=1 Tax=Armillaria gallica TaxID=47427 RepID=A0A2H3E3K4_ARMGA|nr:hypothetical protein ARMGADRAFT_392520 [Armillaria gallica]
MNRCLPRFVLEGPASVHRPASRMAEKQQRLVLSIIDFLNQSITDGTVKADDKESLEIAIQCIGEAFGVDPSNKQQVERLAVKPATLQNIFDVYLKTMNKVGAASQGTSASASASTSQPKPPTADDKVKAEKLKQAGNSQMTAKNMMNNPQMMAMAQQMAANGGFANLMQNPALADMMGRVQSGNMPSMEEVMANPSLRQLAEQFGELSNRKQSAKSEAEHSVARKANYRVY